MGKGKRSREPGTKRRTILQIDSNKVPTRSNVSPHEEVLTVPEAVDDQLAEFLKEISALEEENKLKSEATTDSAIQQHTTVPSSDAQVSTVNQTELPEGWQRVLDTTSGYHYYWHVATNQTSWEVSSLHQLTTQSDESRENPAGLSLISAYSETDSDNSPPAFRKVENNRETHSIPQPITTVAQQTDDPCNTQDNTLSIQPITSNNGHKVTNTMNTVEAYQPIINYYKLPLIHAFTQTENTDVKPTDDALRPLIQQLVAEVKHKLDFLGINLQQVNQLQGMLIELETRVSDWRAGYLPSEYTLTRLQESTRVLREYEQSAAPVGWGCTWDPNQQKYQYIQTSSGRTMWEYPSVVAVSSEVLGDEDMVLSGSEDGECPPLPPLPPSPTSGPPPPPNDLTSQPTDPKLPIEPIPHPPLPSSTSQPASIQSSKPPLPDLPPSETSIPPPLPNNSETIPTTELPPLPPNNSPLPPCPDVPASPLPPSDNSDMSHSPASISPPTNSPRPPLPQDTSMSRHVIPPYDSQYYIQQEQQHLVYAYYNPTNSTNYDAYSQATYLQHQYSPPAIESPKSPQSTGKSKSKKSNYSSSKKIPPSSLSTHAVSLKKKGMAGMLEKWQQLHSVEASSEDSDSEIEEESSLKDRIAEWKKEQFVTGKAKENANFQNIHGNWKDKIKRAKHTSTADSSLLHLSQPGEG